MIERHWNADVIAKILGVVFLAVGALGFFPNPIVAPGGVFEVNMEHNAVHLVTGAIFLVGALFQAPVITIRVVAVLYAIVALLGFAIQGDMLFGMVAMNMADRWLHLLLAMVLLTIGFLAPMRDRYHMAHM
jgi:hypothetical protein